MNGASEALAQELQELANDAKLEHDPSEAAEALTASYASALEVLRLFFVPLIERFRGASRPQTAVKLSRRLSC